MTTTDLPPRNSTARRVVHLLAVVVYFFAWYVLLTPDWPVDVLPFLAGAAVLPGVHLAAPARRFPFLNLLLLLAVLAWLLLMPAAFTADAVVGMAAWIVCAYTVSFAYGAVTAWRETSDQIDVDLANLTDDGPGMFAEAAAEGQIIALSGYAGSGKDTVAGGLLDRGWTRASFADKVREFAYTLNPLIPTHDRQALEPEYVRLADYVDEFGWDLAKRNPEVRALLQRLGTDCGRELLGENVWVDAVMRDLPEGNVVITDCRFPNEAAAIRAAGGHVVRIERPGVEAVNTHKSERALDDYDEFSAVVKNDGSPEQGRKALVLVAAAFRDRWPERNTPRVMSHVRS